MSRTAELLLAALLAACSPAGDVGGEDPRAAPVCSNPGKGLEGFFLARTREFPQRDHVGVRLEYRSPDGERLFFLVGVGGESGEGLPLRSTVVLADGTEARVLGRAGTWVMAWRDEPPCSRVAVIGNGMRRRRFLSLMSETGLLPR